jgi:CHAT domain-containing protein
MTRGLMYAEALRVSVSLWNVDDQTTSDLIQQFYKNLWQSKMSHAASLRQAQLALWKQGKAPVLNPFRGIAIVGLEVFLIL